MNINSHIIKLTGRAELPEALEMGSNYHVSLEGAITQSMTADNEDGSVNMIYTFKPVKVEVLNPLGHRIQAKDTRSKSQLFRARIWKQWTNSGSQKSFDEYYDRLMDSLIVHADEIADMY
jgi:hypothetical protein